MKKTLLTGLLLSALVCVLALAQSATPIRYPAAAYSDARTMEAQAVPTSPTVVTTSNLIFTGGWVSCSSARTITITDGNSISILPAVSVSANQIVALSVMSGAYVSGGFSISASGSGCSYHVWWRQ